MRDDYNNGHDFKRKSNKENKDNALKNENKTDDNINSNMDNVDIEEKKKNKLFKSFINFFTKISNKIDNLTGLDDDGHDNHKVGNKENINDNIDEHFINYLNIRYNNSNNQKNSKKEFNKYKKQDKVNYEKNITDKEININDFHIKKDKTHKYNDGLVFLRNLKKINKFSKDEDVHDKKTKQFFSANDYLIKNKEIDEDFKNNSDKNIFNEKKINLRDLFKLNKKNFNKIKNRIVTDEETKTLMGAAIFGLILIIIASSSYYFFFYQPFQEELNSVKIAKLNELNSIYKGPLALDNEAFTLKSQIENANSPEEIKTIDIIRPATESWRYYHNKEINIVKDDFNRVMVTYTANKTKNIITDVDSAHKMVADNDALVLANMEFKKPNTVVIPILITRLQAGAGLISVGSIVDIYILKSDNNNNSPSSSNSDNGNGTNLNSPDSYANQNLLNNENNEDSSILDEGPDISGVTVLAIMRSKDSGSIDANYIKTKINANGIITNQIENSQSFSTDVEEMLRGAIAGGFNEALIAQLLDKYGLKLADYERRSNLAELDIQYLLLIEVPRTDVSYTINNMDNLILTIPTEHAPNWMIDELKSTYA